MSNWIEVKGAIKDVKELTRQLTGKQLATGISRGINKTLMKGRTEARKAVKAEYNIPQSQLSGINYNKSSLKTLTGSIYATTKPIQMDAFGAKFETPQRSIRNTRRGEQRVRDFKRKKKNTSGGVSIEVHKGKRVVVPFAFMIVGAKPRVFARGAYASGVSNFVQRHKREQASGSDIPIKPLVSVTVHQAVINPASIKQISNRLNDEFPKDLVHELKFLISKLPKSNA